jgi:hypothetical protein
MFCKYKDVFGKPKEGVHKYRWFNVAVVDVGGTVVLAALLAWLFSWPFGATLIGMFLLGIVMHRMFCVRTTVDHLLFR